MLTSDNKKIPTLLKVAGANLNEREREKEKVISFVNWFGF